ncbi:MAG TPA: ThiF family adenylyltransferase, partial [Opitutaceae bacterium]|nr:ThiF family adenylyltransferase [Opitutaceae bacterium]
MDSAYMDRFGGVARLLGVRALERLFQSHVAVVGIGGVGSWVVEALARSGVGNLTLIDLDDVCITNTNRQLPALET